MGALVYGLIHAAGTMIEKRASLTAIQRTIFLTDERQKNIKALEHFLEDTRAQETEIDRAFVHERSIVDFITALEHFAVAAGVVFEAQNAILPTQGTGQGPEFQLHVEGRFDNVMRFIGFLEVMPYQISFNAIDVSVQSQSSQGTKETLWAATMRLTLLSFIQQM